MSWLRIRTVVVRHWYVLWRAPQRWFEIAFWPLMDVVLWGSLGLFVARSDPSSQAGVPYLLAGLVMFWVVVQVQFTSATGLMEETWTRNLLNVLTTPVTELEYVLGLAVLAMGKVALCMLSLTFATTVMFGFDLTQVGWAVIPIGFLLAMNGFAMGFVVMGLVIRFGQSAEILLYAVNYVVMAVSGVFFPVDALPGVLQPIARILPTTQAFAALRTVLDGEPLPGDRMLAAAVGSVVVVALGLAFVLWMLRIFRNRGLVTRYS